MLWAVIFPGLSSVWKWLQNSASDGFSLACEFVSVVIISPCQLIADQSSLSFFLFSMLFHLCNECCGVLCWVFIGLMLAVLAAV